jgi:hypothetical protein
MSEQAHVPAKGEMLYEYTLQVTRVAEYGVPVEAVMSGQAPPAEGARFDVHFEGPVTGPKFSGSAKGADYLHIRADGRIQLDIHAEITTEDGKKIALAADGVLMGAPPVFELRENVTLMTSHPEYSWVNTIQIWATGTADLAKGEIRLKAYAA